MINYRFLFCYTDFQLFWPFTAVISKGPTGNYHSQFAVMKLKLRKSNLLDLFCGPLLKRHS